MARCTLKTVEDYRAFFAENLIDEDFLASTTVEWMLEQRFPSTANNYQLMPNGVPSTAHPPNRTHASNSVVND